MPIDPPHGSTRFAYRSAYTNTDLLDTLQYGLVKLLDKRDSSGQGITKADITHGQGVVTLVTNARLWETIAEEIGTQLMIQQRSVLLDDDI